LYAAGDEIAANIVQFLAENSGYRLRLEGHANPTINPADIDSRPREYTEELQLLSEMRARAVLDRLVELGADPSRLEYHGLGGDRPLVTWEDTANWWRNRRVEFVVLE